MTDSALALCAFGSDKAVVATDVTAGVHTVKVTTANPTDGIVVAGFGASRYVIGTVKSGGVHTLCATTSAANAAIALPGAGADKIVLATMQSNGVHVIAVTTNPATSGIVIDSFGAGFTALGTVQSGGVHILAVTATPDNGLAVASFGAGNSVIAAAKSGNVYSLALSGLAPPAPLDLIGSGTIVQAVSSARKLKGSYAGPAIRLRETGADAEQDIGFVNGLLDTAAAASFIGANSGRGKTLYDHSGNGNHFIQATKASQPTYGASNINSKPGFTLDGSDDCWSCSLAAPLTGSDLFALVVANDGGSANGNRLIALGTTGQYDFAVSTSGLLALDAAPNIYFGNNPHNTSEIATPAAAAPFYVEIFGGTQKFAINSVSSTIFAPTNWHVDVVMLGSGYWTTISPVETWKGQICEFYLFSATPSASDLAIIISNVKSFYGIA